MPISTVKTTVSAMSSMVTGMRRRISAATVPPFQSCPRLPVTICFAQCVYWAK